MNTLAAISELCASGRERGGEPYVTEKQEHLNVVG